MSIYDPCSRILPVALKKYKLDDDWQNYALFIQSQSGGLVSLPLSFVDRCLSFDERPLELVNRVKDRYIPSFVLKHLKQVEKVDRDSIALESHLALKSADQSKSGLLMNGGLSPKKKNYHAVAVYEYKAERDDEINVAIGDTFKILKTESGWCVVEKDGKNYWVPASCLMESEEREEHFSAKNSASSQITGIVIYDYKKISPNEMSIKSGDQLVIHKKYNHWLLAECNDQRGWVPSCYVSIRGGPDGDDYIGILISNHQKLTICRSISQSPILL